MSRYSQARSATGNVTVLPITTDVVSGELADQFKHAMRRLTSSVAIIASRDGDAPVGMVATAVISVSTSPPALLICINRSASLHSPLMLSGRFSVNLLSATHSDLVPVFAGQVKGPERFAHGQWEDIQGLPCLADAQSSLVCTLDSHLSYGTHDVIIGRVDAVRFADCINPLLWENGSPAISARLTQ
ncbi:flavin reductase family protein [Pseudomonas sp. 21TX0197]|uniref:flavin reductase family protein n=1 Tax=Pseudomonas TaxID=286 RepID=UPI000919568A|nr:MULTISPECIES: flavin reductase family protein [Pseudomonas]MDB6442544.1 flavin reductase family protein [Pseudomonas sp. 21TX0197]MDT8909123.1 flavin reductase family protein [Pseudomonas prosekii]SFY00612.1 NADH-FMN oxidoreductase RutF, flavin reductase (DIM6/NTAB) family [Pseudomonas sp. NFACC36]SIS25814.1 NADH-FMN oxidoreductase RutF, flavin reductase (DIM6/NTAB) family [Pseudomonas sp. 7SR1]